MALKAKIDSTRQYVQDNHTIQGLRKVVLTAKKPRKVFLDSISGILLRHLVSVVLCLRSYPKEIILSFRNLIATKKIESSKIKSRAIVIGNGPSQGYLNDEKLNRFTEMGGETICINYWNLNASISSHVPTWMIFSDPATFDNKLEPDKSVALIDYLKRNPLIKISGPYWLTQQAQLLGLENPVFVFVDSELTIWKNIHPLFPRGYLSMTLYKALAWALYLGYHEIGVIGMDNTYPRNFYCDEKNRILNLETHAAMDDYVVDQTNLIPSAAVLMQDMFLLFRDLECFPTKGVFNLDPFSLTDRFQKVPLDFFLNKLL